MVSVLYFSSFMLIMAINQMSYSEKFKASWMYFIAPLQQPGRLILGGLKSVALKFYIPIFIIISVTAVALTGIRVVPNLVLGLVNQLLICIVIVYVNVKRLPFSVSQEFSKKGSSFIRGIFTLIVPATIGFAHYFIYDFTLVVLVAAAMSSSAIWLGMKSIADIKWQQVNTGE